MVLKPRAAVGITILQHYTSLLEWDSLFIDLYLEWDWSLAMLPWALPVDLPSQLLAGSGPLCPPGLAFLFLRISSLWLCSLGSPSCCLVCPRCGPCLRLLEFGPQLWEVKLNLKKFFYWNVVDLQVVLVLGVERSDSVLYIMYIYVCMFLFFFRFFSP